MKVVFLIRHALPDWTRKDILYHLPPGPPLTAQGIQEAEQLGGYLRQAGVQRLFSSPLERAVHTAQIVARITGVAYEIQEGLIEWQPGDTEETVCQRTWPVFELASQLSEEIGPVGLVTHGGPIAALLAALGMSVETLLSQRIFDHSNPVPTGGAWQVAENGAWGTWKLDLVFQPAKPAGDLSPAY